MNLKFLTEIIHQEIFVPLKIQRILRVKLKTIIYLVIIFIILGTFSTLPFQNWNQQILPEEVRLRPLKFDPNRDVFVHLHIPRTGGSYFNYELRHSIMLINENGKANLGCNCPKDRSLCYCKNEEGNLFFFGYTFPQF